MALEITVRYGDEMAASGRLEPGDTRLDLLLPPLPAERVPGRLEVRVLDGPPPSAASASCISEWLRCGDAAVSGDRVTADLTFDTGSTLGDRSRPHESTLYLTVGTALVRVGVRVPSLVPGFAGEAPPATAAAPAAIPAAPAPSAAPTPDGPVAPAERGPAPAGAPETAAPPVVPPGPLPIPPPPTGPLPGLQGMPGMPPPPYGMPQPVRGAPYGMPPPPGYAAGAAAPAGMCRNHPTVPTSEVCQWCRNSYCDQCLVDFRGARLCGWCKQASMAQMQRFSTQCDPKVVGLWARVYDWMMVAAAVLAVAVSAAAWGRLQQGPFQGPVFLTLTYAVLGFSLLLALPPAIGLGPGRKWAYIWQMMMLIPSMLLSCMWAGCLGMVFWPAAIVLLIYWVKPEVRDYFENGTS